MNFRRFVGPLFLVACVSDWFSIWNGVGLGGSISMSLRSLCIHVVCWAAAVAAIYSASHVDKAVIVCFNDPQHVGVPLKRCTIPDIDFLLGEICCKITIRS